MEYNSYYQPFRGSGSCCMKVKVTFFVMIYLILYYSGINLANKFIKT